MYESRLKQTGMYFLLLAGIKITQLEHGFLAQLKSTTPHKLQKLPAEQMHFLYRKAKAHCRRTGGEKPH